MSEPMTSEPPPFEITLRNDAGHGVLNIPDAPQSMVLAITNRSATVMQTRALGKVDDPADRFHFELRFRPHTLRSIGHIELAPESTGSWRVECRVDHDHTQVVSIRSVRRRRWNAGETEIIRLQRISAEPRGGTRLTRVEVATQNLAALGSTDLVAAHHTLNMRVARSKVGAFDDARRLRSGSGATIGPITAGFVDGAGLVADGVGDEASAGGIGRSSRCQRRRP